MMIHSEVKYGLTRFCFTADGNRRKGYFPNRCCSFRKRNDYWRIIPFVPNTIDKIQTCCKTKYCCNNPKASEKYFVYELDDIGMSIISYNLLAYNKL